MAEKLPNTIPVPEKNKKNTWEKLLAFWKHLAQNSAKIHGIISSPAGNQEIANHFNKIIHNK